MNPAPDRVSTTRILVVGLGAVGSAHGIVDQMEWKLSAAIAHGIELQKATNALVKNALPTLLVHVFRLVARQ